MSSDEFLRSPEPRRVEDTLSVRCRLEVGPKNLYWPSSSLFNFHCRPHSLDIMLSPSADGIEPDDADELHEGVAGSAACSGMGMEVCFAAVAASKAASRYAMRS